MTSASQSYEGRGALLGSGINGKEHRHRRRFIGPMPESVLTSEVAANRQAQKKRRWFASSSRLSVASQEDEDEGLRDVIKAHAYEFFKGHGGKDEDWGEEEEMSVREEMLQCLKQSEWGKLHRAKESGTKSHWVGTSFDIGTFLGVNVLDKGPLTTSPPSSPPASPTKSARATSTRTGNQPSAAETFITAPSQPPPHAPTRRNDLVSGALSDLQNPSSYFALATPSEEQPETGVGESLQGSSRVMDRLQAPDLVSTSQSNGTTDHSVPPSKNKGKKKQVRYAEDRHDDEPASPSNVLARSGPEVAETSAGAIEAALADVTSEEGGVIMRGRRFHESDGVLSITLPQIACWSVCLTRTLTASAQRSMRIKIGLLNI
jgi:hypothetical protein